MLEILRGFPRSPDPGTPGDPASYYYALYKTVDGNMRAYVRAGGPAYAAGMLTNDIIDKLDAWESRWFPIATATLERHFPAASALKEKAQNPKQLAPYMDLCLIGDGEESLPWVMEQPSSAVTHP